MAKASSRGMHRGVEEEEDLLSTKEVPLWHGEAVPARPRQHQARGRCRRHIGKTPHPLAPDLTEGKAKQLETKLEVAMAETQGAGGDGAEGIRGNRPDLTDRQVHRCGIYRSRPISAANSGGSGRNRARRRRRRRSRQSSGERRKRCGRVEWPGRFDRATWSGSTRQAGADRWAKA
jgi:hypothetical protein